MTGHKKEPWVIVPGDEWTLSMATIEPKPDEMDGVNYWAVASCNGRRHEARANLALIAAAPDLLEALEDMAAGWAYIRSTHGDLYGVGWDRAENKARAAIARARGEA